MGQANPAADGLILLKFGAQVFDRLDTQRRPRDQRRNRK